MDVTFSEEDKTINVGFGDSETENTFNLSKRRIYHAIIPDIADYLEFILTVCPEMIEPLREIKNKIDLKQYKHFREIVVDIREKLLTNNDNMVLSTYQLISDNYSISIESKASKNEELEFKDKHAKILITIGYLCKLVIAVLSHFNYIMAKDTKQRRGEVNHYDALFLDSFKDIFDLFSEDEDGEPVDLASKLLRFVSSAVDNTSYSDKVIWEYLKNKSINEKNLSLKLFRQIIKDIIPKLDLNKSVVSFLHVVIKKQIEYQFTQKFKVTYKPITAIRTDKENSTNPFTRIEQKLVRLNEAEHIYGHDSISYYISFNKFQIDDEEFKFYFDNLNINSIQIKLIGFFVNKMIGSGSSVMQCSRAEFIYLFIFTKRWLRRMKLDVMAYLLCCNVEVVSKKNINRGKLFQDITGSKVYQNILNKYSILRQRIEEQNVILNFISEIINTDFNTDNVYRGDMRINLEKVSPQHIANECLTFLEKI